MNQTTNVQKVLYKFAVIDTKCKKPNNRDTFHIFCRKSLNNIFDRYDNPFIVN